MNKVQPTTVAQTLHQEVQPMSAQKRESSGQSLFSLINTIVANILDLQLILKKDSQSKSAKLDRKYDNTTQKLSQKTSVKGLVSFAVSTISLGAQGCGLSRLGSYGKKDFLGQMLGQFANQAPNLAGLYTGPYIDAQMEEHRAAQQELNTQMMSNTNSQGDNSLRDQVLQVQNQVADIYKTAQRS